VSQKEIVYILGNPNSGKTTLFNYFTGQKEKTGNYEGVTVSSKEASFKIEDREVTLVDVPGTYSLSPRSEEERIAVENIKAITTEKILFIADIHSLKLHLFLFSQLKSLGLNMVLVLNKLTSKKQASLNVGLLSKEIQAPVAVFDIDQSYAQNIKCFQKLEHFFESIDPQKHTVLEHYERVEAWLKRAVYSTKIAPRSWVEKITVHPFWGTLLFFVVLLVVFQVLFSVAEYPIHWIEALFEGLSYYIQPLFNGHWVGSLLVDGVLTGIAGVVVFVPQIGLLFLLLELLDQSGYLPRAAYLMDGLMKKIGLSGRSVIPMISSYACAVPAIMASRSIKHKKERLISILTLPFITCSARLPVYLLLISLVVPSTLVLGIISLKTLVLFGLYLLGIGTTMLASWVLSRYLPKEATPYFLMQIPAYQKPSLGVVLKVVWSKTKSFLLGAGKYIVLSSMVLWLLGNIGPEKAFYKESPPALTDSYLGLAGKAIEPVIKPLGYDWKIGISIISSFAAREVFVGTMATIYRLEESDEKGLMETMKADVHHTGNKVYTLATGISLLLFYAFSLQCVSTIAIVKKETGGWKWPVIQFIAMLCIAYCSAFTAYQLFS